MIDFRSLEPVDIAEMAQLDAATNLYPWSERDLRSALVAPAVDCRVVVHDHCPVGYFVIQRVCDEVELQHIVIFRTRQSRGYAGRTLRSLMTELKAAGVLKVFLEVRASNNIARRLYSRAGFIERGIREGYYEAGQGREDAILMQLKLVA